MGTTVTVIFTAMEDRSTAAGTQQRFYVSYSVTGASGPIRRGRLSSLVGYTAMVVIDTQLTRQWRLRKDQITKLAFELAKQRIQERLHRGRLHHTEITELLYSRDSPQECPYDLAHTTVQLDTPMAFLVGE